MGENEHYTKILDILPAFNADSILEFVIDADKRHLSLPESEIQFFVDLPSTVVPDNNFCGQVWCQ